MSRHFRRAAAKKFLKEQQVIRKYAEDNNAPLDHAIMWKRKNGYYEPGAKGPKWCPLPPERWSVFRSYGNREERRDRVFQNMLRNRDDCDLRRVDI